MILEPKPPFAFHLPEFWEGWLAFISNWFWVKGSLHIILSSPSRHWIFWKKKNTAKAPPVQPRNHNFSPPPPQSFFTFQLPPTKTRLEALELPYRRLGEKSLNFHPQKNTHGVVTLQIDLVIGIMPIPPRPSRLRRWLGPRRFWEWFLAVSLCYRLDVGNKKKKRNQFCFAGIGEILWNSSVKS